MRFIGGKLGGSGSSSGSLASADSTSSHGAAAAGLSSTSSSVMNLVELAQWVPLRLSVPERQLLAVLEQTLHVSEYTDHVDVSTSVYASSYAFSSRYYNHYSSGGGGGNLSKTQRILDQILEACHIATGLVTASGQHERDLAVLAGVGVAATTTTSAMAGTATASSHLPTQQQPPLPDVEMEENAPAATAAGKRGISRNSEEEEEEDDDDDDDEDGEYVGSDDEELEDANDDDNNDSKKKKNLRKKKKKKRVFKMKKNNSNNGKNGGKKGKQPKQKRRNKKGGIGAMFASSSSSAANRSAFPSSLPPPFALGGGDTGGSSAWASRSPAENAFFFQTLFEIGRRNKVLNPSSMRTTYGKLMYLLQDAQNPTVAKSLGFSLYKDLVLVQPFLEQHHALELLSDPRLDCAVQFISDRDAVTGQKLPRYHVQSLVQGKQKVTQELVEIYGRPDDPHHDSSAATTTTPKRTTLLSKADVLRVIESLADAVEYIESNVRPVQQMLQYLEQNFDPQHEEKPFSLALRGRGPSSATTSSSMYSRYGLSAYGGGLSSYNNSDGPTLSHSHGTQYVFVWQSLRLWCKVMRHMHRLWVCADDDLLSTTSSYNLYNTGQGLNRVQACPRVRKVMSQLLQQTQAEAGTSWVGLSVIHLGDRDVPNALIFIDKYTQIPRFLNPLVQFLQELDHHQDEEEEDGVFQDERILDYIEHQFGSIQNLKMAVLADYFKHGFDGSGDDGGSCIDGRLTSSWNWTSRLVKKSYYHAFMLSGFQGFDGEFR